MTIRPVTERVTLEACGHKFRSHELPAKDSCQNCWFAYFATNPPKVKVAIEALDTFGQEALEHMFTRRGGVFFVEFKRQMDEYVAERVQEQQREKETPVDTD